MAGAIASKDRPPGRSRRRYQGDLGEKVLEVLGQLEARLDGLEERLRSLESREQAEGPTEPPGTTCSSDLIGCLDDCVDDVKDLRKRGRLVRTSEGRP